MHRILPGSQTFQPQSFDSLPALAAGNASREYNPGLEAAAYGPTDSTFHPLPELELPNFGKAFPSRRLARFGIQSLPLSLALQPDIQIGARAESSPPVSQALAKAVAPASQTFIDLYDTILNIALAKNDDCLLQALDGLDVLTTQYPLNPLKNCLEKALTQHEGLTDHLTTLIKALGASEILFGEEESLKIVKLFGKTNPQHWEALAQLLAGLRTRQKSGAQIGSRGFSADEFIQFTRDNKTNIRRGAAPWMAIALAYEDLSQEESLKNTIRYYALFREESPALYRAMINFKDERLNFNFYDSKRTEHHFFVRDLEPRYQRALFLVEKLFGEPHHPDFSKTAAKIFGNASYLFAARDSQGFKNLLEEFLEALSSYIEWRLKKSPAFTLADLKRDDFLNLWFTNDKAKDVRPGRKYNRLVHTNLGSKGTPVPQSGFLKEFRMQSWAYRNLPEFSVHYAPNASPQIRRALQQRSGKMSIDGLYIEDGSPVYVEMKSFAGFKPRKSRHHKKPQIPGMHLSHQVGDQWFKVAKFLHENPRVDFHYLISAESNVAADFLVSEFHFEQALRRALSDRGCTNWEIASVMEQVKITVFPYLVLKDTPVVSYAQDDDVETLAAEDLDKVLI